jgi:hypothetical protein
MISYEYETNLICDAPFCTEIIRSNHKKNASFETIREFGEQRGWQVTRTYVMCPDHNGGFDLQQVLAH